MSGPSYQRLMDDIERSDVPEIYKQMIAEIVRRNASQDGVAVLERQERIKFARKLLDQREERRVIYQRLQNAYGICRSQAYADIANALQIVQKSPGKMDGDGV